MRRRARANIFALTAAFVAFLAISALWIVDLRLGPTMGLEGGAMVLFVPAYLVILTAVWFVVRAVARVRWRLGNVLAVTIIVPLVLVMADCGPVACFVPGPHRMSGWFIVLGLPLIALAHHFVLDRS